MNPVGRQAEFNVCRCPVCEGPADVVNTTKTKFQSARGEASFSAKRVNDIIIFLSNRKILLPINNYYL